MKEMDIKLFTQLQSDNNLIFSPYSIHILLSMLLEGAEGKTKNQILNLIENPLSYRDYHTLTNKLTIANSFWILKNTDILPTFTERLKINYDADIFNRKPDTIIQDINSWCDNKTKGLIKEIIRELEPNLAAILINAIYFKGLWEYQFDVDNTDDRYFYGLNNKTRIPTMYIKECFSSVVNDEIVAIDIPYKQGMSLTIIMPLFNPVQYFKELTYKNINKINKELCYIPDKLELYLPKFEFDNNLNLNNILSNLGVVDMFDKNLARFPYITKDDSLFIGRVIQKSIIKLDEKGTEAAAVTRADCIYKSCAINKPKIIRIDKPFMFVIKAANCDAPLFMGNVMDIKEK